MLRRVQPILMPRLLRLPTPRLKLKKPNVISKPMLKQRSDDKKKPRLSLVASALASSVMLNVLVVVLVILLQAKVFASVSPTSLVLIVSWPLAPIVAVARACVLTKTAKSSKPQINVLLLYVSVALVSVALIARILVLAN